MKITSSGDYWRIPVNISEDYYWRLLENISGDYWRVPVEINSGEY